MFQMITNFITSLLQALLVALVPLMAACILNYLKEKTQKLAQETDDRLTQKYLQAAARAAGTAVAVISQTYVESLKKEDKFSVENQREALKKAKEIALGILDQDTKKFLEAAYEDLPLYLEMKIEETVASMKTHS